MYMFATCLACTIIITQLFVSISNAFGVSKEITGEPDKGITLYKSVQAILTSVLLGWISLGREMSTFKNLAILSIISLIFTIVLVMVELPLFIVDYAKNYDCLE